MGKLSNKNRTWKRPLLRPCPHNHAKRSCRICSPQSFCCHDKYKTTCRICCPQSFCSHQRFKSSCTICEGTSVCEHKKHKWRCVECKGTSICEHNRIRGVCRECKGGSVCEHNRTRSDCKDCLHVTICEHDIILSQCSECFGNVGRFCIHNKRSAECTNCNGNALCIHDRRKDKCVECEGTGVCEHKTLRYNCVLCHGASTCLHGKQKSVCKACGGKSLCVTPFCEIRMNEKYRPYCFRCFVFMNPNSILIRNYKTKEIAVRDFILLHFPNYDWRHDKKMLDACSLRRPDLSLNLGSHVLFIEIKENGHDFGYSYTNKRLCELFEDVGQRPCIFLRFNPDSYIDDKKNKIASCWKKDKKGISVLKDEDIWNQRLDILANSMKTLITNIPTKSITIEQLFFDVADVTHYKINDEELILNDIDNDLSREELENFDDFGLKRPLEYSREDFF